MYPIPKQNLGSEILVGKAGKQSVYETCCPGHMPPSHSIQVQQAEKLLQYTTPGGTTYLLYSVNEDLDIT